jgi:hypothetical protein
MTIIDADLAKSLDLPLQKCTPVPVAGMIHADQELGLEIVDQMGLDTDAGHILRATEKDIDLTLRSYGSPHA